MVLTLGADVAFGEEGGLGTDTTSGSRWFFDFGTDFGSPVDEAEVSLTPKFSYCSLFSNSCRPFLDNSFLYNRGFS